jgi:hypothetical protein
MSVSYNPGVVTSGLVLCLDAANQRSYPGSGIVWTDISGNGKNGTVNNSPTYSAANGGIFILDGVNDYIALPSQNDAQAPLTGFGSFTGAANNSFTLEMWIKTSQITGSASYNATGLIARDNGDIYANLTMYNGYVYWTHYDGAWQSGLKSTTMVANNTWHQIVYVNNSNTTGSIYVDSVNEVTAATTLLAGNYFSPDNIGWGYSGQYFLGSLGSVKFYDRSLSAAEVAQNFNALRGRYGV